MVEGPRQRDDPRCRDHAVGRFESGHPAQGGRNADGAAGIRAQCGSAKPRRDRGGRSPAGSSRTPRPIPRVPHGSGVGIRIGDAVGKLMQTGLAHDNRTRRAQPGHDRRVLVRQDVKPWVCARRRRHAGDVDDVFDGYGDTGQRARRTAGADGVVDTPGGVQRLVGHHVEETIQRTIVVGNPSQACFDHPQRRHRSTGDTPRDLRGRCEAEVFHRHCGVNLIAGD